MSEVIKSSIKSIAELQAKLLEKISAMGNIPPDRYDNKGIKLFGGSFLFEDIDISEIPDEDLRGSMEKINTTFQIAGPKVPWDVFTERSWFEFIATTIYHELEEREKKRATEIKRQEDEKLSTELKRAIEKRLREIF